MTQISSTTSYLQHHSTDSIKMEKVGGFSLGLRGDEASTLSANFSQDPEQERLTAAVLPRHYI